MFVTSGDKLNFVKSVLVWFPATFFFLAHESVTNICDLTIYTPLRWLKTGLVLLEVMEKIENGQTNIYIQ